MLSKFSKNTSEKNVRVHFSETSTQDKKNNHTGTKQAKIGPCNNYCGQGKHCDCSGAADKTHLHPPSADTTLSTSSPPTVSSPQDHLPDAAWEYPTPNVTRHSVSESTTSSFPASIPDTPSASFPSSFPDTPPSTSSTDSSQEDSQAPYTYHEMSRLAEAASVPQTPEDEEVSNITGNDVAGPFTYAEILRRKSPATPTAMNVSPLPNTTDSKAKRSAVEKWMAEKNTADQMEKLSNL